MESESGNDDLFDCIFMADNRFHGVGYREGFERGTQRGLRDGHRHGVSHGAKLSAEVSFYYGFAVASKCLLQDKTDTKSRKRIKAVDALLELINKCPLDDPYYTELQEDMDRVRAKFRQEEELSRPLRPHEEDEVVPPKASLAVNSDRQRLLIGLRWSDSEVWSGIQ